MIALLLAAAFACPDDQVISLEVKAWKAALQADRPGSDEQHAEMAALRMKTVPDGNEGDADCFDKPVAEGVDVFETNLTGEMDKLVQVRFRMCKGTKDEWQSLRLAVLVPLGGNRFCLLQRDDLAADRARKDLPCGVKLPLTLDFREMTQKGRKVLEVRDQSGSCEGGAGMTNVTLALYEAQQASLKKIFDTQVAESSSTAAGQTLLQQYKLTLGKEVPRTIHLERCIEADCDVVGDYVYKKGPGTYVER